MECINMFNSELAASQALHIHNSPMDPRISFSNDFADTQQASKHENNYRESPVSSDFEFSVANYSMITADEVIFEGMLLPPKVRKMTLRDELLVGDDESEDELPRMHKSSGRWKELLGRKKVGSNVSKKGDKSERVLEKIVEEKTSMFVYDGGLMSKKSQGMLIE